MDVQPSTAYLGFPPWKPDAVEDLTIVNVALPTSGRKLHFPESDLQWVVTAYALSYGWFLLLGGRAADPWTSDQPDR
jgi:MFS family permease